MPSDRRFPIAIAASSQALPEARKREGVPTATVFPYPSDLKTDPFEKASNGEPDLAQLKCAHSPARLESCFFLDSGLTWMIGRQHVRSTAFLRDAFHDQSPRETRCQHAPKANSSENPSLSSQLIVSFSLLRSNLRFWLDILARQNPVDTLA
jgi:hypothetical protein